MLIWRTSKWGVLRHRTRRHPRVPCLLFDLEQARSLPLSHGRIYSEAEIWDSFTHFTKAVIPFAQEAGVRIGLRPDDPPVRSLGGVARIFGSAAGYQRAIDIAASENFGLCLCVGSWAEGGNQPDKNVYEMIETFGPRDRISPPLMIRVSCSRPGPSSSLPGRQSRDPPRQPGPDDP